MLFNVKILSMRPPCISVNFRTCRNASECFFQVILILFLFIDSLFHSLFKEILIFHERLYMTSENSEIDDENTTLEYKQYNFCIHVSHLDKITNNIYWKIDHSRIRPRILNLRVCMLRMKKNIFVIRNDENERE